MCIRMRIMLMLETRKVFRTKNRHHRKPNADHIIHFPTELISPLKYRNAPELHDYSVRKHNALYYEVVTTASLMRCGRKFRYSGFRVCVVAVVFRPFRRSSIQSRVRLWFRWGSAGLCVPLLQFYAHHERHDRCFCWLRLPIARERL